MSNRGAFGMGDGLKLKPQTEQVVRDYYQFHRDLLNSHVFGQRLPVPDDTVDLVEVNGLWMTKDEAAKAS